MLLLLPVLAGCFGSNVEVIDGDTIRLNGTRVRLYGIDAPELHQECRTKDGDSWACGRAAKDHLTAVIGGRILACWPHGHDQYKRRLAVCYHVGGGQDIGAVMVRAGMAVAYRRYSTNYVAEQDAAQIERVGIWQGTFTMPEQWRRESK